MTSLDDPSFALGDGAQPGFGRTTSDDPLVRSALVEQKKAWLRLPITVCVSAFLFSFVSVNAGVTWLAVAIGLEGLGAWARKRLSAGELRMRAPYVGLTFAMSAWWVVHALLLWGRPSEVARIAALMDLFSVALYGAMGGHRDVRLMFALLTLPLFTLLALLLQLLWSSSPPLTAAFASLATFGACATILANGLAMHDTDKMLTHLNLQLQRERDSLDARVRQRTEALWQATNEARASTVAKAQFMATISHELRTPLNAVIGYSALLEEDLAAGGQQARPEDAARIGNAGKDLLAIVDDILDLADIEAGKVVIQPEDTDIQALLSDIVARVTPLAQTNANELHCSVAMEAQRFFTDARKLRQIVFNLADNACNFTHGGRVEIAADIRPLNGAPWLSIIVSDTGRGIPSERLEEVFQPFVQIDSSATRTHGGTGLGLALTKQIVNLLGGRIELQSKVGEGTRVTTLLPKLRDEIAPT